MESLLLSFVVVPLAADEPRARRPTAFEQVRALVGVIGGIDYGRIVLKSDFSPTRVQLDLGLLRGFDH